MSSTPPSTATAAVPPARSRRFDRAILAELIVLGVISVLMVLAMAAALTNRGYNSDDVAFQLIYDRLAKNGHVDVVTDVDTFIIKAPFDLLATALFGYTRHALFFVAVICAFIELAGVAAVTHITARLGRGASVGRVLTAYLPAGTFLALCAVPYSDVDPTIPTFDNAVQLLNINGRNAEVGLGLLAFVGLSRLVESRRRRWWHTVVFVAGGLASGILLYSDQFFLFSLFAAVLLAAIVRWLLRRGSWREIAGAVLYTGLALGTFKMFQAWGRRVGIHAIETKGSFIRPNRVWDSIFGTGQSVMRQLHADIWGLPYAGKTAQMLMLNMILVVLVFAALAFGWSRLRRLRPLELMIILSATLTMVAFMLSDRAGDPFLSRYVYPAVVMLLAMSGSLLVRLVTGPATRRLGALVAVLLLVSTLANAYYSVQVTRKPFRPHPQELASQIIGYAEQEGATKGYGGYWVTNPVTYLSGGRVTAAATGCMLDGSVNGRFFWLVDRSLLEQHADKTFLVVAPQDLGKGCAPEKKSGKPLKTFALSGGYQMFIYDHDIGEHWQLFNYEREY